MKTLLPGPPQLFLIMSRSGVLQLWVFLVGLWQQAHCATLPGRPSAPPEGAGVPVPHLRMLSLGLDHLLKGVEGHSRTLEKRGQQGAQELEQAAKHLEELSKQSLQTGRTHRQVRKEQQVQRAGGDRLWRTISDLQVGLDELKSEQGAMRQRMSQIFHRASGLADLRSAEPSLRTLRPKVEEVKQRLAALSALLSAERRLLKERRRDIDALEKEVSQQH